jgi:hypothetical protein
MRNRLMVPLVSLSVALACWCAAAPRAASQAAPPSKTAPSQSFDPHDLSGPWVTLGPRLILSNLVPAMTPWGKEKLAATRPSYGAHAVVPALGNDPMGICDPLGYPRIMIATIQRPMEFVQTPSRILQHFEFHETWRPIWTDGRALPKDPDPRWNGYAVGKWEGDTLVVDSNGFDERSWLDHFGNPHSDQMTLHETYRRVDADTLEITMTLADPKTYKHPWEADKFIYKNTKTDAAAAKAAGGSELIEEYCVPSEEQLFNKLQRDPAAGLKPQ